MLRALAATAAALLVIVPGILHGLREGRWQNSQQLEAAVARVRRVPLAVGDWRGQPAELSQEEVRGAEADGCLVRRYENARTGEAVTVVLLCGRPGPISVHTPDVCYVSSGYDLLGGVVRLAKPFESGPRPAEFCAARFRKPGPAAAENCHVFWAWSAAGDWSAPANPRIAFAPYPALYKLYVIREPGPGDESLQEDPAVEFIRLLLPELRAALFVPA
jgi:hypothetical protein